MKKFGGDKNPAPGPSKVVANPTSQWVQPPLRENRFARNGKHPNVVFETLKATGANQAAQFRTKQYFSWLGQPLRWPSTGVAGNRTRWRFACHSGPFAKYMQAVAVLMGDSNAQGTNLSTYARCDLTDVNGVALNSEVFYYGVVMADNGWDSVRVVTKQINIQPDTDYYVTWTDVDSGALITANNWEIAAPGEINAGYLPQNFAVNSPIYADARANEAKMLQALWKRGGAQLMNCTVDNGGTPISTTATSPTNVFVYSNPGVFSLDNSRKARLSQLASGVPVRLAIFASNASPPSSGGGTVSIVDQGGNAKLSTRVTLSSPGWTVISGTLPQSTGVYSLMINAESGGNALNFYAASVYEYE